MQDSSVETDVNISSANVELLCNLGCAPPLYKLRALEVEGVVSPSESVRLWAESPKESTLPLDIQQIEATLDYFVQCSERVDHMQKTYKDVVAVSELLDEKEKDLELAARIGQSLLERNNDLQTRTEFLEEKLTQAEEVVTQLRYELQTKAALLESMAEHEDSNASTPDKVDLEILQGKVNTLEVENANLKLEATQLRALTLGLEEKERELVNDCWRQLDDANKKVMQLTTELTEKSEMCVHNQRVVDRLNKEVKALDLRTKNGTLENEDLDVELRAAQDTQAELAREILELQERYSEVVAMLNEAQAELRGHRRMNQSTRCASPLADSLYDSLASEMEASDSGFSSARMPNTKSFQPALHTAEVEDSVPSEKCDNSSLPGATFNLFDQVEAISKPQITTLKAEIMSPKVEIQETPQPLPEPPQKYVAKMSRSVSSESIASLANYPSPPLGEPGRPGTRDLEIALRKINSRRKIELQYQQYRKSKGMAPVETQSPSCLLQALYGSCSSTMSRPVLFKPFMGSKTLHKWRSLATSTGESPLSPICQSGISMKCSPTKIQSTNVVEYCVDDDLPCSSKYSRVHKCGVDRMAHGNVPIANCIQAVRGLEIVSEILHDL